MEIKFVESQADLHKWLEENHDKASELWIGFYKKGSDKKGITYAEALDEALAFGWIDGIRKSVGDDSYTIRFTPRKRGSIWSAVNIKRAGELSELGLMQPSGLQAFTERDEKKSKLYSYEERERKLDDAYEHEFKTNTKAWDFFEAQPPGYRKLASWWVMSAKQEETRQRRLSALIEGSEKGERLAEITGGPRG
jgi:uncharacterized protein YdeI (YjbR/CyaY-like superfamily)